MRLLAHLLYDTAFSLKSPGSKNSKLLEQKIPATYLALEEVVAQLSNEMRLQGNDPVLDQVQYETLVSAELRAKHGIQFR